jgi:hypothetical protein
VDLLDARVGLERAQQFLAEDGAARSGHSYSEVLGNGEVHGLVRHL